jgi:peptidoglycan/LPS O-acetylase OafA/YrhL
MQTRLPSLDGLRAISIIGVLYAHATITPHFFFTNNRILHFLLSFIAGDNGVNIFFVISGFLITNLLISEETRNQKIDLKAFYIRRVFRILPVYFIFLLVVFMCQQFSLVHDMDVQSFLPPLTFTTGALNIPTGWTLGHT